MKRTILLLSLLITSTFYSQICGVGSITLIGQSEVNTFVATYNGTCTTIDGNLLIRDQSSSYTNRISNLSGLSFLTTINGSLTLQVGYLSNLTGLNNIQTIAGDVNIRPYSSFNNNLKTITFPSLISIGGGIAVANTISSIEHLDFPLLETVANSVHFKSSTITPTNNFTIYNLSQLQSIDFSSLLSINGSLTIQYCSNNLFTDISFNSLQTVTDYINIDACNKVTDVNFPALTSISNSYFEIDNCADMSNVNVPLLASLNGRLSLIRVSKITTVNFAALTSAVGSITIYGGYGSSSNAVNYLHISNNPDLQSINFNSLTDVGDYFRIDNNTSTSFTAIAFTNLTSVGTYISVYRNTYLNSVSFASLANILGSIVISNGNDYSASPTVNYMRLTGPTLNAVDFSSLASIGNYMYIDNTNLQVLANIPTTIGGYITITDNSELGGFSDFSTLTTVNGNLIVNNNNTTSGNYTLDFNNLQTVSGYLDLNYNSNVTAFNFPLLSNVTGSVTISDGSLSASTSTNYFNVTNSSATTINFAALTTIASYFNLTNAALTNLSGFANLASVGTNVTIASNAELTDISQFSASIGANLSIVNNPKLNNFTAFSGLTTLNGNLHISNNNATNGNYTIDDFTSLQTIGGYLDLDNNANVTSIDFSALTSVSGSIIISDANDSSQNSNTNFLKIVNSSTTSINFPQVQNIANYFYVNNAQLTNLSGFAGLTSIGDYLRIDSNDELTGISNLSAVTIGGNITINNNRKLSDLSAFNTLTTVQGDLKVQNNNTFASGTMAIDDFTSLTTINGMLNLSNNANVTSVNFPVLNTISGSISITDAPLSGNSSTNYLEISNSTTANIGFGNLTNISNAFTMDNSALANLSGFSSMTTIGGDILLKDNTALADITSLSGLTSVANCTINNNILSSLQGLENLTSVEVIHILNEPNITDLTGINLASINTLLNVENCANLTSLNGLTNIDALNGSLAINQNNNLTDIAILDTVLYIENNINISNNTLLDECCVLTKFLDATNYIGGSINVSGNNTNCVSIPVIITSCKISQQDTDKDGIIDSEDNCVNFANPNQLDTDGDGIGDVCDNCPDVANPTQLDTNNNGIGDACENATTGTDNGGLGIGTTDPKSQLEITEGDVFVKNKHRGIIMKSPSGKCFRYQPNEEGNLKAKEITCPDN